ncbi:hypothetical protein M3Y99_01384000 [Aphelenchoides fujianensis]|nr:hypothetical protein M3Y99_01384000 [Aphelenchoides fujianensis]
MDFPLVTVCSFNFINKHNLIDFQKRENVSQNLINFILQSTVDLSVLSTFIDETKMMDGQREFADLICNETLRICNIGAEEFDCCEFSKVIMTDMGNCYQIDHPSSTTKQIGVNNGLQLYANFHSEEQANLSIPQFLNNNEMGFRYFVHARDDFPFITSEGIGVLLGHRTFSAISPNQEYEGTIPYPIILSAHEPSGGGQCIDRWPAEITSQNLSLLHDDLGAYSSTKCMAVWRRSSTNAASCTPLMYNFNGTFPTCTVYQNYYDCLTMSLNVSADSSADEIMRKVDRPACPPCKMECQRWDYQIFNSYSQPFSRSATAYLQKQSKSKLDKDFVGIDIYFRDIAYTEYKQVHKTTMNEIWSSLGGNMGLFLGMSLLSVIEVLIYLCKITWLFFFAQTPAAHDRQTAEGSPDGDHGCDGGQNRRNSGCLRAANSEHRSNRRTPTRRRATRDGLLLAGSLKRKSASFFPPRHSGSQIFPMAMDEDEHVSSFLKGL